MHYRCLEYEVGGDKLAIEKSGGVFSGTPGPRRGSSAIDGWIPVVLLVNKTNKQSVNAAYIIKYINSYVFRLC